jgi:hypothetical protein
VLEILPSPWRVEDDEDDKVEVLRWREFLDGLGWPPKRPESGPMESRLSDCRGRTRGSAMPAKVLSMAAAAKASSPPGFWLPEKEEPAEWWLWSWGLEELAGGAIGRSEAGSRGRLVEDRGGFDVSCWAVVVW